MIRHLFVFKTRQPDQTEHVCSKLRTLLQDADGVREWEVGPHVGDSANGRAWDGMLSCDFDTMDDLDVFMQSPAHQQVVGSIGPSLADVAIIDATVSS